MAKYNLLITQEPGALFIKVLRAADGADVWRGRCHPSEKDKTIAEAYSEVVEGKPLRELFKEKHDIDNLKIPSLNGFTDPGAYRDEQDIDHLRSIKFTELWSSPELDKLVKEITKKHSKDFRVVDLTEGG